MNNMQFGEFYQDLRFKTGLSLRKYCNQHDFDPALISKIERNRVSPPKDSKVIEKHALALGLEINTEEFNNFVYTAQIWAGRIPDMIMSDKEVLSKLPVLLRTLTGENLSDEKLDELIELIKRS